MLPAAVVAATPATEHGVSLMTDCTALMCKGTCTDKRKDEYPVNVLSSEHTHVVLCVYTKTIQRDSANFVEMQKVDLGLLILLVGNIAHGMFSSTPTGQVPGCSKLPWNHKTFVASHASSRPPFT